MLRTLLVVTLLSVASVCPADDAATVAALKQQADAWDKAIVRKDRAAIEANMSPDFRNIDGFGNVADKAAFLEGIVAPRLEIDPYDVLDLDVRLYGDTALLAGRTRMTGRYDGKPFASHYRYTDVYVRRGGTWKVASVQITRLPPDPPPPVAEIDPVAVSPDRFTVLLDNEHVRVVAYTLAPGEKDVWHTHPPKVSYVVSGGSLRITTDDGKSFTADETAGTASWMGPLGRHFAENVGPTTVRIVLVEVKSAR
jgi:ketosteroid isomerase-like protein/quercetin dioxygenase-like cupin family protein